MPEHEVLERNITVGAKADNEAAKKQEEDLKHSAR